MGDKEHPEGIRLSRQHVVELIHAIDSSRDAEAEALLAGLTCAAWPTMQALSQ